MLYKDNVHVGSRLGLVVDTDRSLHLYADGEDQGVVAPHIPDPCYFMFDLFDYCTKVFFLLAIGVTVCDAGGVSSCFSLTFTICKFAQALLHRHIVLMFYTQIVVFVLLGLCSICIILDQDKKKRKQTNKNQ